jgi:hypothetical protein
VSEPLGRRQLAAVSDVASHAARFCVEHRDAADAAGWGAPSGEACFVLALEVLDNLPHDRAVRRGGGWWETRVEGVRPAAAAGAPRSAKARKRAAAAAKEGGAVAAEAAEPEALREVLAPLNGARGC